MRVACQQCGTAYSVADEKVAGRRVRLRCKHCSESMVIDGTTLATPAPSASSDSASAQPEPISDAAIDGSVPVSRGGTQAGAGWHVAVGDDTQGPYTLDELAQFVAEGRVARDTFVYREGFADWTPAASVDELMTAAAVRKRTSTVPPPPPRRTTPHAVERLDMGHDPFAEAAPAPISSSPRLSAEDVLGGSRHEGTVQFSVDQIRALSAVSAPSLASATQTLPGHASGDDSGLIDMASLSAAQSDAYSSSSLAESQRSPLEPPHITPMSVPVLSRPPGIDVRTKVLAGLSAFGLVLIAGVAVIALSRPQPAQPATTAQAAQQLTAAPPATAAAAPVQAGVAVAAAELPAQPAQAAPAERAPAAEREQPARAADDSAGDESAQAAAEHTHPHHIEHAAHSAHPAKHRAAAGDDSSETAERKPKASKSGASSDIDDLLASAPRKPKPSAKSGSPSIDDLLDGAISAKKPPPKPEPAEPKSDLPKAPSRAEMLSALGKAKAKVDRCKGSGVATAEISIEGSSGRAAKVNVSGVDGSAKSCVENAVRSTPFPKFQKDSFEVKFPFKLSG